MQSNEAALGCRTDFYGGPIGFRCAGGERSREREPARGDAYDVPT
jgi:hypothetical protein